MESTFTTQIEDLDCLVLDATSLNADIEAIPGLTEPHIKVTGPKGIVSDATVDRGDTRWTLTVPNPEPTVVSGNGNVVMAGDINGSVVMSSSGVIQINGNKVTNTVVSSGAAEPVRAKIRVPAHIDLYVPHLHNGGVRTKGRIDTVDFRGTNAYLEVDEACELEADTTNGSITSSSTSELIDVSTTNGKVVTGSAPRTRVRTTNGPVRMELSDYDHDVRVRTTNGDIDIDRGGYTSERIETSTTNGRERIR